MTTPLSPSPAVTIPLYLLDEKHLSHLVDAARMCMDRRDADVLQALIDTCSAELRDRGFVDLPAPTDAPVKRWPKGYLKIRERSRHGYLREAQGYATWSEWQVVARHKIIGRFDTRPQAQAFVDQQEGKP